MDEKSEELCLKLGKLPDEYSQKEFLARFPELVNAQLIKELSEAVRAAVRVNIRKAKELAEAALAIARQLKDNEMLGFGLRAKANALWFAGECKCAVELFQNAAELFERAGNLSEVGRTLSSSIQSLALLGEYDKAFAAAERAREIFSSLGESWRLARLDINVANIYHRQNRYADALAVYERAYRQLLPHRDMEGIGVALHNMAVCLIALDDFPRALSSYQQLRDVCARNEMPLLVAQADYNIAFLYYLRGDYTKALELLRSTRDTYRKNGDTYHLGLCDLDQSEIFLELSLIEEAADMAQNSLEHFEQLGMGFESARSLTNLAIALNLQGDSTRALDLFGRAGQITRSENNQVWPHLIDLYRALVLLDENKCSEARELCLPTAEFFRSAGIPSKHVLSLLLLVRICLRKGEIEEAARLCSEALKILETLDAPILAYQAQFLCGQVEEARGDRDRAYHSYQQSRLALEALRSSLHREELKIGFMRNRLEVYSRLVQLCLDRNSGESSSEEALSYVEAAKSRALRDLVLGGAQPSRMESEESETDRRLRDLRKELNWYYHRIEREQLSQSGASPETVEPLQLQAKAREHELLRLLLDAPSSEGVGAALESSRIAGLAEIRATLGTDAALLEYFGLGDRVFAAVVNRDLLQIIPLAELATVAQRLRLLQFQLSKFRLNRDYLARFHRTLINSTQAHLRALYDDVFAPLTRWLSVHDLVIVPFGLLHSLPFHALFDGQKYVIDKFSVSYQPSASMFTHSHRPMEVRCGAALILGIEDPRAPFIREEVEAVAGMVSEPRLLFGPAATEQALRDYGGRSRLVHVASHGYFRQDSPMFSSIRLADSYLTLYDLYHMNLPVDLLTLSGCVTGLNVVAEGDELLGLTRGLLYAGARSLLLSLWEVDDRSTAEFMKEFYQGLNQQHRKADAVRCAMLELRERFAHPYYWAPFKLIGRALAT